MTHLESLEESATSEGYLLRTGVFDAAEIEVLRAGVESAARRAVALIAEDPDAVTTSRSERGHLLQSVAGVSLHWEPDTEAPTLRNMLSVTHLDERLEALWGDPRLARPAADLLGVAEAGPLTSKISYKRAGVGSEFIWHQDYTFLEGFLGPRAAEVVTAMVLLDDADADSGALQIVPGSHGSDPRPDGQPPEPDAPSPVVLAAPAGSVVLFGSLALHCSGPNGSAHDRRALLLLYQPAGRPALSV